MNKFASCLGALAALAARRRLRDRDGRRPSPASRSPASTSASRSRAARSRSSRPTRPMRAASNSTQIAASVERELDPAGLDGRAAQRPHRAGRRRPRRRRRRASGRRGGGLQHRRRRRRRQLRAPWRRRRRRRRHRPGRRLPPEPGRRDPAERAHPAPLRRHRRLGRPRRDWRRAAARPLAVARRRRGPARRGLVSGLPRRVGPHYQGALTPTFPKDTMTLSVSSAFDGGNIRLVAIDGDRVDLEIVKDHQSDFYQWFYFRLTGGGGRARRRCASLNCAGAAYPMGWDGYRACLSRGPRGMAAGRHRLCRRRADDQRHAGLGQRLDRLFRALHDGAAPRSRRLGRGRAGRRLSLARPDAGRPRDRLFPARRRPAAGLALRPPASRRDDGRMVDGGRARAAARRGRSGDAPAAREGDLPHRPQHEPGRLVPRPFADQRGRREPQPRMARAEPREEPGGASTSATRWTGPASISRWTSMATRRSPPISSPASRASPPGSRSSRICSTRSAAALLAATPDFQTDKGYEVPAPARPISRCRPPSSPSATARCR